MEYGRPFELRLANLPAYQPGVLFLGLSDRRWGALTLPFDLTGLGMPGCVLRASGEWALGLVSNSIGAFTYRTTSPNVSALSGLAFVNHFPQET
jgi:hypothetical protein